jgi:hypothetical protein
MEDVEGVAATCVAGGVEVRPGGFLVEDEWSMDEDPHGIDTVTH